MRSTIRNLYLVCLLSAVLLPATAFASGESPEDPSANEARETASKALASLVEKEWEHRLQEDPLLATQVGKRDGIDRFGGQTAADQARRAEAARGFLAELEQIPAEVLGDTDRVTYEVFRWQLQERVAAYEVGVYRFPFNADSGFHTGFARLPQDVPLTTVDDYRAYIARLRALPGLFDDYLGVLRQAVADGWTQPRAVLDGYEHSISSMVVENPEESVFYAPFRDWPVSVPESARAELAAEGRQAVSEGATLAYRRFLAFFKDVYLPAARESLGASELPGGGAALYANRVRHYTTLDLGPDEIHRIGLQEVARIRAEMDGVIEKVGFEGSFADFLAFLRTDPRFYAETPEEILERASFLSKKMDGKLPSLFGRLPRQPYGVEPVPDYLAPKYTAGRYVGAPLDSKRAGTYWVNTYALDTRPLYALEALTLHEAVPGHHLQIALSAELDLPPFRGQLYISAFGEGWGLYSERLGLEAGFYEDPYSDFGRLTYEMWRACRLVVDTGIHHMGWSRQRAIDYLARNTALSLHEVTTEVDRYISWPGQALSYKIGELEIRRLRAEAEKELGTDFDLRAFHDRVLEQGSLPLVVLRQRVESWIEAQKTASAD